MNEDLRKLFEEMRKIRMDLDVVKNGDVTRESVSNDIQSIDRRYDILAANVLEYIKKLSDDMELLNYRMDEMESYSRRNCLLIHGVSESDHELCEDVVIKLLSAKQVATLDIRDIDRAHRLGSKKQDSLKKSKSRPIIVKFVRYSQRNKVFRNKSKMKGSGMTITESLTKQRQQMLSLARENHGVANVWTQDGKIIVLNGGIKHKITTLSQLKQVPIPNIVEKKETANNTVNTRSRTKERYGL